MHLLLELHSGVGFEPVGGVADSGLNNGRAHAAAAAASAGPAGGAAFLPPEGAQRAEVGWPPAPARG